MRLGGIIFCCLGIIIVVLVANGRWSTVWAAALGQTGGSSGGSASSASGLSGGWGAGYTDNLGANVVGGNSAPL